MSQRPIMDWESQEPFKDNVVWWTRLDGRYQIEVQRKGEREGTLFIWDREQGDEAPPVLGRAVDLSYGAIFGPDVEDVAYWEGLALAFADGKLNLGEV
jgi:hypothetical protein